MQHIFGNHNGVNTILKLMKSINSKVIQATLGSLSNLVANSN